jgi:energy-coupling factor transporter ATP-binding protein EcfA2
MNCLSLEFETFTNLHFFYNWMNVEEYLLLFAALYKIQPQLARKRANDLLEKIGLASKSFAPIGYYSRGMKQRLGLARALINNPKIIFLDEPTLGLDPKGQQDIQKLLLDLNHEKMKNYKADKIRIYEVISNLLKNAIKFTKEGTISVTTEEKKRKKTGKGGEVIVKIKDTTVSTFRRGIGLGLFISRSIIEAHGGRIWAENNADGKGATFAFSRLDVTSPDSTDISKSLIFRSYTINTINDIRTILIRIIERFSQ